MEKDEKRAFLRFAVQFNVLLLASLYILLTSLTVWVVLGKIEGTLKGWQMLITFIGQVVAFSSWVYCVKQSWELTWFNLKYRWGSMAYLFGVPLVLVFVTGDIITFIFSIVGAG